MWAGTSSMTVSQTKSVAKFSTVYHLHIKPYIPYISGVNIYIYIPTYVCVSIYTYTFFQPENMHSPLYLFSVLEMY